MRTAGDTTITVMTVDPRRAASFALGRDQKIFFPAKQHFSGYLVGVGRSDMD